MADEARESLEEARLEKLQRIVDLGVDPWGSRFDGHQAIADVRALEIPADTEAAGSGGGNESGSKSGTGSEHAGPVVRVAGRIVLRRDQGKVFFLNLRDWTGLIQIFVGKRQLGDAGWALAEQLDLGDLIGVDGRLGRTRTGELTVFADKLTFLAKSLRPPPEKWYGLHDIEQRYRQRYVDLFSNPDSMAVLLGRSRLIASFRQSMARHGFVEVETPTMQSIAGGAAARPFVTHHNALDIDLFLRIAPELYLKRLLVGGMERVFEIGRVYRNEGLSPRHNPEFTMLEAYQAYADYHSMMDLTESLICEAIEALGGGSKRSWGEKTLDFAPPWPRATYHELLARHAAVDPRDFGQIKARAEAAGLSTYGKDPVVVTSELFEAVVEDRLDGPIFVIDYPADLCPLTKRKAANPAVAERFELYIHGIELANAYTELNDPRLQEELFRNQLAGLPEEESMAKMDDDFIRALKHAMPPAGGLGIGIDRLCMILFDRPSVRDVILFPLMRPQAVSDS
jgi:lysyl-tRNA synthetase class 2